MSEITRLRLFGFQDAFAHPVTVGVCVGVLAALLVATLAVLVLSKAGRLRPETRRELYLRIDTWAVLSVLILGPILLGAFWTILAVCVLSLLCFREYARVTGLFREKMMSLMVVLAIMAINFAALDHWYGFFVALGPLSFAVIAAAALLKDQPKGYVQRVALASLAVALFGLALGHLSYIANDTYYRPILMLILLATALNDVFAYLSGKLLGRRKLCPNTSPHKTMAGALGALILTTALGATLGHFVFPGSGLDTPLRLIGLGLIISAAGQCGDLMLSAIKRDVGIKDVGTLLPGHGGLLDRFDSLLLVAPCVFHYVGYFRGIGLDQPIGILTGNG